MAAPGKIKSSKVAFASSSASSKLSVSNNRQVLHGRLESASPIIVGLDHSLTHIFRHSLFSKSIINPLFVARTDAPQTQPEWVVVIQLRAPPSSCTPTLAGSPCTPGTDG